MLLIFLLMLATLVTLVMGLASTLSQSEERSANMMKYRVILQTLTILSILIYSKYLA